jgi:hypothetical protein
VPRQKAKGKRQKAKGKRQKAKGKRQKAKGKRQKAKGKGNEERLSRTLHQLPSAGSFGMADSQLLMLKFTECVRVAARNINCVLSRHEPEAL